MSKYSELVWRLQAWSDAEKEYGHLGKSDDFTDAADAITKLEAENAELAGVLHEGRRAIGDHFAPNDCYATGPLTGDPIRDLVQCPACSFIAMHDATLAKLEAGQ